MAKNPPASASPIITRVQHRIKAFEFEHYGFASLEKPLSIEIYRQWLNKNYNGEMTYLADHLRQKEQPKTLLARAQSAIVVSRNYVPHPQPITSPIKAARIAYYARGADYHHWFKQELDQLSQSLMQEFPGEEFIAFTDSSPVLERDLAYRAGLGWVGKNTCLIHSQRGSLFFVGEIYTSLSLDLNQAITLHPDRCGTCTRCIDICPTDAIKPGKQLDARRCISYLTIEAKSNPPEELRTKMGDWLFGCDLCQTVCPWNEKAFDKASMQKDTAVQLQKTLALVDDLRWILTSSNKQLQRQLAHTPLSRASGKGLKRNALIVAANKNLTELQGEIKNLCEHPSLGELAQWALQQLSIDT